jgi:hypothetical protein
VVRAINRQREDLGLRRREVVLQRPELNDGSDAREVFLPRDETAPSIPSPPAKS